MDLINLNKWWENKSFIEDDKHIKDLNNFKFIYKSKLLDYNFIKNNVYTIRGPRQIGKTTFLKLFIKDKLKNNDPKSIFYWSCDNLNNYNDIIKLINDYSDYCEIHNSIPKYILIDEITSIKDWQKAIKFIIDNAIVKDICFILTGSNIIDLKKGTEKLPGRRGKDGKDLFFFPLNFKEYVKLVDNNFYEKYKKDSLNKLYYNSNKLKILFKKYLITGGIPLVINEYENNKFIPNYIYELYYSWIIGDILKEGKNEQTLKEIIKSIIQTYTTPISWDSLAKKSSIKSHLTISDYIELLSNLLVLFPIYFKDINQNKILYYKNKKIFFYDLFIINIFLNKLNLKLDESKIVEGIVASELKRKNLFEELHYTKIKKETDFVFNKTGIEVKYQNKINKIDFLNKKYFNKFYIISKDIYEKEIIPIYLYLFNN
ncbi:MAG: ATP-binding protein [Candidatus Woesearchaeota archaeon]